MTTYNTITAIKGKIKELTNLIATVAIVPKDMISTTDAEAIIKVLAEYRGDLEKELLDRNKK